MKKILTICISMILIAGCRETTETKMHKWVMNYEKSIADGDIEKISIDSLQYQLLDMNRYYLDYELKLQEENRRYDAEDPILYMRFIIENNSLRRAMDSIRESDAKPVAAWRVDYHYAIKTNRASHNGHAQRWFDEGGKPVHINMYALIDTNKILLRVKELQSEN